MLDLETKLANIASSILDQSSFLGSSIVAFLLFPIAFWIYHETKSGVQTSLIMAFLIAMYFSWMIDNNPAMVLVGALLVVYVISMELWVKK